MNHLGSIQRVISSIFGAVLLSLIAIGASAQSTQSIAEKATDPSAILTQLGFQYWSTKLEAQSDVTGVNNNNIGSTYLMQPVLPLSKKNVLRPALPYVTTPGIDSVSGIGDLFALDLWLFQLKHGTWGIGPAASLPVASNDALGTGKYEVGPVALYMYKGMPKNLFGILAYNLTSFAGDDDRQDVNKFTFQPIWTRHFDWGYIGWTDLSATIDWEDDNRLSFPVGIRIGKVFSGKTLLNLVVQPYFTFNEGREDDYGIKISATFIKPGWLDH